MIPLNSNPNVDNSDLTNYPDGRVKDNTGTGNGTPVNRNVYGDLHSTISKLMRLYGIAPNGLPDNETSGFQLIDSLVALASKNDYIYPLTTDGTILSVDIKLSLMKNNEFLVCLASADKTTETQIKGIGATTFAVTYSGSFKANEYVRIIKTNVGVSIIRIADWNSLDAMASELLYLKKASQIEEDAGTIDTVATTPLVNKTTFIKRVNGADSVGFLATAIRNGLYPKEHFAIVENMATVKNVGWFAGLNVGSSSGALPVSGNVTSAFATSIPNETEVEVAIANVMANLNYFVRIHIQSESGDSINDINIGPAIFKPGSTSTFNVRIREYATNNQNLKIHLEVVQL